MRGRTFLPASEILKSDVKCLVMMWKTVADANTGKRRMPGDIKNNQGLFRPKMDVSGVQ